MGEICPIAYKLVETEGPRPVAEALIWLGSLIATEMNMEAKEFEAAAKQCFGFNKALKEAESAPKQ